MTIRGMDFKKKKRVVIKIGSSSLTHPATGNINYIKMERLVRELCDLRNQGIDVCLVSSGAIAVGKQSMGLAERPRRLPEKQALRLRGPGPADVHLSEVFRGIQSEGGPGPDD